LLQMPANLQRSRGSHAADFTPFADPFPVLQD
jgi:hypothetical protein